MAEAYGPEGRAAYIRARTTFDIAWPLVLGSFLFTAIGWLFWRARPASAWAQRARWVPVLGVVFDGLENLSTSLVMVRYPLATPVPAALAPAFTFLKWVQVAGSFALPLGGLALFAERWASRAKAHSKWPEAIDVIFEIRPRPRGAHPASTRYSAILEEYRTNSLL